jgi:hypothetical protein
MRQRRRTYISKQGWAFMKKKSAQKEETDFLTRWKRAYDIAGKPGSPLQIPSVMETRAFARLVLPTLRKLRRDSENIELAIAASEVESQLERWAKGRGSPSLAERKELIAFVAAIASRRESNRLLQDVALPA